MTNKSTGPMSRDELLALVNVPHGEATRAIRAYDPLYARTAGEKVKWRACYTRTILERGYYTVEASTKEEAEAIANEIGESKISWGDVIDPVGMDSTLESVEPLP